jgi:hypothetical protein
MQDAFATDMTEHIQRHAFQRMMRPDDRNA